MDTTTEDSFTQNVTRVSDEAVQYGHDTGTTSAKKSVRKPKRIKSGQASPVITVQVSALIWQKALGLSKGDARRIQIISTEEVIVHNHPYSWR